ncbi:MAG: putative toxin-antitoxin system toxin component, PIN family [Muribaculaceae bacterium]
MIYAVIDTNVLISALLTRNQQSATVITFQNVLNGYVTPLYNGEILEEYSEVMNRPKFKFNKKDISLILEYFSTFGINIERTPFKELMIDEKDRVFYEVALSKDDSFLVTGNIKHFPSDPKVVTPAEFLKIIGG